MSLSHVPVMLREVVTHLSVQPGAWYVDATFGGGGYTRELLRNGARVLSIDADSDAIRRGTQEFSTNKNWIGVQGNFRDIHTITHKKSITNVHGIVFDLGLSSYQLDSPERGFSYRYDTPLDMRFDTHQGIRAKDIVQTYSEGALYDIFATYSEEQYSQRLARAVCRARTISPIETTGQLSAVIDAELGRVDMGVKSRVYQAIRMEVNDELRSLKSGLVGAEELLARDGRLAVVSFHSLEDRIVKLFMLKSVWQVVTKKPVIPNDDEITNNTRARSAKLRVAIKL